MFYFKEQRLCIDAVKVNSVITMSVIIILSNYM